MRYSRYDDIDSLWDTRLRRSGWRREGFAWGTFLAGLVLGALIF